MRFLLMMKAVGFILLFVSHLAAADQRDWTDKTTLHRGKKLHFRVLDGRRNDVILFESGGGDTVSVWRDLLPLIEETTGATLVTYDRPGFGESEIDPEHHGLADDIERLESGLKELGYGGPYTLVAHSLGGFYATMFASRHPDQVKAAVLIDVNLACFFTDELLESLRSSEAQLQEYRRSDLARYYFSIDYEPMARTMRNVKFPERIPVIDFVAGRRDFPKAEDGQRWKACHAAFAAESGNRTEISAYAGHYIYRSNPEMIVAAVNAARAVTQGALQPALLYAVTALNEMKRKDEQFAHSEDGLNQWGYDLLRAGNKKEAVKVFELNSVLRPSSWHVWDSLAEGYEALGDVASALRNYRIALEIDPGANHAAERIRFLQGSVK